MAEMTRVEAAAVLDAMIFGTYPDDDITIEKIEMEAVRFAIAALRGLGWVRTADRLPTEEDAIEVHDEWGFTHKEVAVLSSGWPFEALVKDIPAMLPGIMDIETIENKTTTFPYWMPLPKPPEVEE